MVALVRTDIPTSVDTVEKLAVWAMSILQQLHPGQTVVEATGVAERVATAAPFYITASQPAAWRFISRASLELTPNWQSSSGRIWTDVQPLSSQAIPAEYKVA
ncbi:glucose-6-phosphate dehydrogenase [Microcoleus sp. FACHB-1515]|uniref:glucose-6-phosphate dehydrogenase n=1 Tax=Cyanophyceae TaxID=3028117 RepID=UPI001685C042|nr:glucose-6-phosphate dehydrogenase [Microcoleus sp. FACHB-1515]MBD2090204.1 glucose-6-phosphate dehydrogenase [Microcoleus sp. FACHB-1515]